MALDDLALLMYAGNPFISMETLDEPRALRAIRRSAEQLGAHMILWSATEGLVHAPHDAGRPPGPSIKPLEALRQLDAVGYRAVYVFRDLTPHCRDPQIVRRLRDLYFTSDSRLWTIVLLDSTPLPPDVRRLTVSYGIDRPNEAELKAVVNAKLNEAADRNMGEFEARLTIRELEQLVRTLQGLTTEEAARVVAAAVYQDDSFDRDDLPRIMEAKRARIGTLGCLEAVAADVSPGNIGGLANLKRWLKQRHGGFTAKAREFGLDPPRGVLLLGVQGCGKSLCAKVVASAWGMPLLRMDPGVLYQKFIGESEARLREALAQAESMAPVVLWIDEIEKAFASASADSADGGLSQRMFGTLLSWMQDHRRPIFLVATANNIAQLPPELMRKGRFDEVFFIDLPGEEQRRSILNIHLRKRRRDPARFDLEQLIAATDGFSGAEIEQAIVSGLYAAFSEGVEVAVEHIIHAARSTYPLSVLMHERVVALRAWADGRCIPAD